ncbi:Oidioi.mRNA.OKI2018_I69.XSR.g15190.t1.cds [Oikopleura dioica]|uniref:Mediator of RNA polymerase II transcription subunit 29 n=1 Tax=Oikopleura dioica TaxID=34765 RepID=A0ABN7SC22_OIKDI|nr:Oidioi.mRNA.OKI2018_I69.XSR.g15190.t1.cds [Oikopleura dioica]
MNPNMNPGQMNQGYGGQPNNMAPQMMGNHSQMPGGQPMMGSNQQQMMQNPHMGQGQQGNPGMPQHQAQVQQVHNHQGQAQATQSHQNEPEDAIRSIKHLAKEDGFKNSLTKLMEVASKAFLSNATADNIQSMETEQKQRGCGTDLRKDLEEAFEEFYHNTDLMESNIRLALQQCLNTLQVIQTIAPSHVNFLIPQRQPPSTNAAMDFKEYNKFVEIVKEQIECAKETTKILQESHRDLHKVGSNFPIRRPQPNQQQQQQQMPQGQMQQNRPGTPGQS